MKEKIVLNYCFTICVCHFSNVFKIKSDAQIKNVKKRKNVL